MTEHVTPVTQGPAARAVVEALDQRAHVPNVELHNCPACEGIQVVLNWRRDRPLRRWVGVCRNHGCTYGRTFHRGDEPMVRTDEQLEHGEVPPIPLLDRYVADTCPSLDYEPWLPHR